MQGLLMEDCSPVMFSRSQFQISRSVGICVCLYELYVGTRCECVCVCKHNRLEIMRVCICDPVRVNLSVHHVGSVCVGEHVRACASMCKGHWISSVSERKASFSSSSLFQWPSHLPCRRSWPHSPWALSSQCPLICLRTWLQPPR